MAELSPQIGAVPLMNADTGLSLPQRYWAIVFVSLGTILAVLDGAIANVALPTIARGLHTSDAASIWIVNAYQIAIMITLLPLASLGDRVGYRRIFIAGLALFTIASLGCALASSLSALTVMRVIQGFGASGMMSVIAALVRAIYPSSMLGRGVAVNAMVVALSSAIGPTVASAVLSVAPWPWLFAINVPIGIVAVLGSLRSLPTNALLDEPYDVPGALMNACVFGLLIMAADGLAYGERPAFIVAELTIACAVGYFFVKRQLLQPAPLLPVDLMRIPIFALSICTSIASFTSQMLAFVALPFWLQNSLGVSQVQTGLYMTPWPLVVVVAAPIAGALSDRYSAGALGGIGLAVLAAGLLSLATIGAHPGTVDIVWRMALCGAGFGLFMAPNNRALLSSAPHKRSGSAGGMLSTARLTGQTLGTAIVALTFGVAPVHAPTIALYVAAAFAAAAAAVSTLRIAAPRRNAAV